MIVIIRKPTFVDPDNPTPAETVAQVLFDAQMQTERRITSPDIIKPFTAAELPNDVITDAGYLGTAERQVLKDANMTATEVMALSTDSDTYQRLAYATLIRIAIKLIPQAAQLLQQRAFSGVTQYAEIDWEKRTAVFESDYKTEILEVNPDADLVDTSSIPVTGTTTASEEIDFDVPYYNRTELYGRNI